MINRVRVAAAALIALPLVGMVHGQQKLSCVKDVVYSQEFLQRYPNAGAACREVVKDNGVKWIRFDARVVKVKGDRITATFMDSYDRPVSTLTFVAAPDMDVVINGRSTSFTDLSRGDKLSFWMPEDRVGFYAKPGALNSSRLAVVDRTEERR